MRSREQKRAHHGLTDFEKGRRGSLLRRDFFVFAANGTKKYYFLLLFWYTFRRSLRFRNEVDVTLDHSQDA